MRTLFTLLAALASLATTAAAPLPPADVPLRLGVVSHAGWLAPVTIGNQTLSVLVDTGSTDLLVAANQCDLDGCGAATRFDATADPHVDYAACNASDMACKPGLCDAPCAGYLPSPGANPFPIHGCGFQASYADSSKACGQVWRGAVTLGDSRATVADAVFGGIEHAVLLGFVNNDTATTADGIMGLGMSGSSFFGSTSVFGRLVAAGAYANTFSTCLSLNSGGVLTLGGYNSSLVQAGASVQYVPNLATDGSYAVNWTDVKVNGTSVGYPSRQYGSTTVDTGTTWLLLPDDAFDSFRNMTLRYVCGAANVSGVCFADPASNRTVFDYQAVVPLTRAEVALFPTVTISLDGDLDLKLAPHQYLTTVAPPAYYRGAAAARALHAAAQPTLMLLTNFFWGMLNGSFIASQLMVWDLSKGRLGFAPPRAELCVQHAPAAPRNVEAMAAQACKVMHSVHPQAATAKCGTLGL